MNPIIACPETLTGTVKIVVAIETILICVVSFFLQIPVLRATGKLAGWQSDFSYAILRIMSVVALQLYFSETICHVRFAWGFEPHAIDQVLGASFLTSFLTDTILGVSLVLHRVAYTIYPYKSAKILSPGVLKCYLIGILINHVLLFLLMLTPLAGYQFCPRSLQRFPVEGVATSIVLWMNTVCNYMVGLTAITAYSAICAFLFIRGSLTLRNNAEIRLTLQVVVMSTVGVFYFVYWEFRRYLNIDTVPSIIIYETITLLYYNAEFAPYLLLNTTFRDECLRLVRRRNTRKKATVAVTAHSRLGKIQYRTEST